MPARLGRFRYRVGRRATVARPELRTQHHACRSERPRTGLATASYAEIARKIGAPGAVRAVARACAANPIAAAICCHRVVRHDGVLSGYRWGVERKRALLAREAAA